MKNHSSCLLCGSTSLKPLEQYSRDGLVQCNTCNFVFCIQIPTFEELVHHYETYPRNDTISQITLKRYQELAEDFESYRKTGNWLDNGCGNGHLLVKAKENNWNAYGTEFTETAIEICRKKRIIMNDGALDVSNYSEGQFDIITFIEVLEHINNPIEEITKFHYLLRAGGIVYITTPNFNSLSRHLLKDKWDLIEYPEHLCYYTPSTIHKLLTENGFKKIHIKTSGISASSFGKAVKSNTQNTFIKEEQMRELAESKTLLKTAKNVVNKMLDISNKGDTIKAFYQKR